MNGRSPYLKHFFDLTVAALALLLLSPLLGLLALLVRLKPGSPVLFRQQRPGLHGRPFTLSKFCPAMQAMTDKRDAQGNLLPDAERLTQLGKFLRSGGENGMGAGGTLARHVDGGDEVYWCIVTKT